MAQDVATDEGCKASPLHSIIGSELSSVEFVRDYVQLRFDGPCLTAITCPTVRVGEAGFGSGMPGYRDALCERIGRVVCSASVVENEAIQIEFDDGAMLSISLHAKDYRAAEAAIFDSGPDGFWVW